MKRKKQKLNIKIKTYFIYIKTNFIYLFAGSPTLVAARLVPDFGDDQSQVARRAVSTWMGDCLANIDL